MIKIYYNRKSIRLKKYDYAQNGMYFITICTHNREPILSKISKIGDVGAGTRPAPTLPNIVRDFKSKTSLEYIKFDKQIGEYKKLWQRNYYEHIIRDKNEYYKICEYIKNNPIRYGQNMLK